MRFFQQAKKQIYRNIRYHWLTESIQSVLKRQPLLKLSAINLELQIERTDVLIDCGANVGDVTSAFARTGATVYAFEPNPRCFTILSKRFKAMKSVHCLNRGAMDRQCVLTLKTPRPHGSWDALETTVAASFTPGAMAVDEYAVQDDQIECIDLDQFIQSLGRRVRLLKIDIEGSEIGVLNRLMNTGTIALIDLVIVETHEKQMPHLLEATDALRNRIRLEGLGTKIRLDWY